ncbi:MAG: class I SAM-dependent methyltransferase [Fimbriimonadaceae bacterium]
MDRVSEIAALANKAAYNSDHVQEYIDGSPHIKHESLRRLYAEQVVRILDFVSAPGKTVRVLDLGSGEGSVTLPFLQQGAHVTAVDISQPMLDRLSEACAEYKDRLEPTCEDIHKSLQGFAEGYRKFDVVVCNSFLHHIPDYLELIRQSCKVLDRPGAFFAFQDPMRYDTLGKKNHSISRLAYLSWRVTKGDLMGGAQRLARRSKGVLDENSMHDNAEYHCVRNGVDQEAIGRELKELGFEPEIIEYFSTQSKMWQSIGTGLGAKNTFGVIGFGR